MSNFRPAGLSDEDSDSDDYYDRPKRLCNPPHQNIKKKIENALQDAIINNNTYKVEEIINNDLKGNVNATLESGWTPLMHASFHSQEKIVKLLLDKGADPNLSSAKLNYLTDNDEQIYRKLSMERTARPNDPRTREIGPTPRSQSICRDYVWGICFDKDCKYRHELNCVSMRSVLKFCRDYQSKSGCKSQNCTNLHVTCEEEKLYLEKAVIPRVLAERYASMMDMVEPAPPVALPGTTHDKPNAKQLIPPPPPAPVPLPKTTHSDKHNAKQLIPSPLPAPVPLPESTHVNNHKAKQSIPMPPPVPLPKTTHVVKHNTKRLIPPAPVSLPKTPHVDKHNTEELIHPPLPVSVPLPKTTYVIKNNAKQLIPPAPVPLPKTMHVDQHNAQLLMPPPPPPPPPVPLPLKSPSLPRSRAESPQLGASAPIRSPKFSQASMDLQMKSHNTEPIHRTMTQMSNPAPSVRQLKLAYPQTPLNVEAHNQQIVPCIPASVAAPLMVSPPPPTFTTVRAQITSPLGQPLQQLVPTILTSCPQPQQPTPQISCPILFDPNRPPPLIGVKRPAPSELETNPSKILKPSDCMEKHYDSFIEIIKNDLDQLEIEALQRNMTQKLHIYEQAVKNYDYCEKLLMTLMDTNQYNILEDFINSKKIRDSTILTNPSSTYCSTAIEPNQVIFEFLEFLVNKRQENQRASSLLESLTRRKTPHTMASLQKFIQDISSGNSEYRTYASDATSDNRPGQQESTPAAPTMSTYISINHNETIPPAVHYQPNPLVQAMYVPYQAAPAQPQSFYNPYSVNISSVSYTAPSTSSVYSPSLSVYAPSVPTSSFCLPPPPSTSVYAPSPLSTSVYVPPPPTTSVYVSASPSPTVYTPPQPSTLVYGPSQSVYTPPPTSTLVYAPSSSVYTPPPRSPSLYTPSPQLPSVYTPLPPPLPAAAPPLPASAPPLPASAPPLPASAPPLPTSAPPPPATAPPPPTIAPPPPATAPPPPTTAPPPPATAPPPPATAPPPPASAPPPSASQHQYMMRMSEHYYRPF